MSKDSGLPYLDGTLILAALAGLAYFFGFDMEQTIARGLGLGLSLRPEIDLYHLLRRGGTILMVSVAIEVGLFAVSFYILDSLPGNSIARLQDRFQKFPSTSRSLALAIGFVLLIVIAQLVLRWSAPRAVAEAASQMLPVAELRLADDETIGDVKNLRYMHRRDGMLFLMDVSTSDIVSLQQDEVKVLRLRLQTGK